MLVIVSVAIVVLLRAGRAKGAFSERLEACSAGPMPGLPAFPIRVPQYNTIDILRNPDQKRAGRHETAGPHDVDTVTFMRGEAFADRRALSLETGRGFFVDKHFNFFI
jgi:hypothetical protein